MALQNGNSYEPSTGRYVAGLRFVNSFPLVPLICVGELVRVGLDNGLSPGRHQAIIWTNAVTLLIRT